MRKGVTPVVATILLISVTLAAAGTLYATVQSNVSDRNQDTQIGAVLTENSLNLETCYNQSSETHLVLRNRMDSAINSSKLNLLLNNTQESFTVNREIVNPQKTFTVEINQAIDTETRIILTNGEINLRFSCRTIS